MAGADAVTEEILAGKLAATVEEMGAVLARTSMSPVIYEVLDYACGLCDAAGDLIAQTNGITLFTGTFAEQVRAVAARYRDAMAPGDVFITNDPYRGGTHPCDMAVIRPLFDDAGDLLAYAISVAHWIDVGGAVPGSLPVDASSTFQEGLRLPAIRLARGDAPIDDVLRIIRENVRLPEMAIGDLTAQLAAARIAARRVDEITARYGAATLRATFAAILDRSERQSRAALAALPDGTYHAEDVIDGDGASEAAIAVRLAVTIAGETISFDYTGSAAARAAPVNCARGALLSAVKTVFKALVAPHAPSNEGWFRPVRVVVPDGTVFSAVRPSPTGWYYEGSAQASELAWRALAPLAPARFCAGTYMSLCAAYILGAQPDGTPFVHIEPAHGGWGATPTRDGASGLIAITDGDTNNYSVELLEAKFPLLIRRYALNTDDGSGAGRMRGGHGLVRDYELLGDAVLYASFGRNRTPPWGIDGGEAGTVNRIEVTARDGGTRHLARVAHHALRAGDRVRLITGGGGGWGPAAERSPAAIAADVADGLLSDAAARAVYGYGG